MGRTWPLSTLCTSGGSLSPGRGSNSLDGSCPDVPLHDLIPFMEHLYPPYHPFSQPGFPTARGPFPTRPCSHPTSDSTPHWKPAQGPHQGPQGSAWMALVTFQLHASLLFLPSLRRSHTGQLAAPDTPLTHQPGACALAIPCAWNTNLLGSSKLPCASVQMQPPEKPRDALP